MTRGAFRLLARAVLLAPARVDTSSRSDVRAARQLQALGLLDSCCALTSAARIWSAIPREHLATLAEVESVAVARTILSLYGISPESFAGNSAEIAGKTGNSAGKPPENGGNPAQNGRRFSRGAEESTSVVVLFPTKEKEKNNNNSKDPEAALLQIGVTPGMASLLGRQNTFERVSEVIAAARARSRTNLAGWVRMALQNRWGMPSPQQVVPLSHSSASSKSASPYDEWPQWRRVIRDMPDIVQSLRAIYLGSSLKVIAPNQYVATVVRKEYLAELTRLVATECGDIQIDVLTEAQCA